MESTCPICLEPYPATWEPSLWLQCWKCFRSVHVLCVEKIMYTQQNIDPVFFMCPDCMSKLKDEKQPLPSVQAASSGDKTSERSDHEKCKRGVIPTGPRSVRHFKQSSGGSWLKKCEGKRGTSPTKEPTVGTECTTNTEDNPDHSLDGYASCPKGCQGRDYPDD